MNLERAVFLCGVGQFGILVASALVPFRLKWKEEFARLPRLHRQMYWTYGGYVVLCIVAFATISTLNAGEIASGTPLARSFSAFVAIFWGIRVGLQPVFAVEPYLTAWWLRGGYHLLTVLFLAFTACYGYVAFHG